MAAVVSRSPILQCFQKSVELAHQLRAEVKSRVIRIGLQHLRHRLPKSCAIDQKPKRKVAIAAEFVVAALEKGGGLAHQRGRAARVLPVHGEVGQCHGLRADGVAGRGGVHVFPVLKHEVLTSAWEVEQEE